jgi:hypothetical protein
MTLQVLTWRLDSDGAYESFFPEEPGHDLAGLEKCRYSLWGHSAVEALGARFLPELRTYGACWVEHEDLDAFEGECEALLVHLDAIAEATGYGREYIEFRLENFLRAVERARAIGGGVCIQ